MFQYLKKEEIEIDAWCEDIQLMEAGAWLKADVQVSSLITVTCHGLILSAPGQGRCQNKTPLSLTLIHKNIFVLDILY